MWTRRFLGIVIVSIACSLAGCQQYVDVQGNMAYVDATDALDRRDYEKAFSILTGILDRGGFHDETSVKVLLADLYLHGRGTPQNVPKGISLLEGAAYSTTDIRWAGIAQTKLALMYETGADGLVPVSLVTAARWHQRAYRSGDNGAGESLNRLLKRPEVYTALNPDGFTKLSSPEPGPFVTGQSLVDYGPDKAFKISELNSP